MSRTASYDRAEALQTAMELFWAKGYHETSMKDLERALSLRPGSIYAAFQSKEALFSEALERYSAQMQANLLALINDTPSPLAALRMHLVSLSDLKPVDRPSSACMLVKSLLEVSGDGRLRDLVLAHLDRIDGVISKVLQRAQSSHELPVDADLDRLAMRIQTYIFGLKIQAQRHIDPQKMRLLCLDLAEELQALSADTASPKGTGEGHAPAAKAAPN